MLRLTGLVATALDWAWLEGAPMKAQINAQTGAKAANRASRRPVVCVYFVPKESKIFTPRRSRRTLQLIRCTPRAERWAAIRLWSHMTLEAREAGCQVTKGARVRSWAKEQQEPRVTGNGGGQSSQLGNYNPRKGLRW